jgi:RNA polymerase sigma-70 factor (ECF subfamily)
VADAGLRGQPGPPPGGGRPRVVFGFTIADGRIVEIELLADPERLRELDLAILDD